MEVEDSPAVKMQIHDLQEQIEQLEETLTQSGTFGKQLLEERSNLERMLQELQKKYQTEMAEFKAKFEVREQEMHNLKMRIEAADAEALSANDEVESMKEKLTLLSSEMETERGHSLKLLKKIDRLEEELEVATTAATLNKDSAQECEEKKLIEERTARVGSSAAHNETTDIELAQLRLQLEEAVEETSTLNDVLNEKEKLVFNYETVIEKLREETSQLKLELSDMECQSTSYFNALEKARQEILEQQVEMQQMQVVDTDPCKRGNSLFSEVDDRRKKLEDGFKSLRAKYASLCQTNELNEGRIRKLQMQLSMQPTSANQPVNASHIFQLEQSLALAHKEIKTLVATAKMEQNQFSSATSNVNDEVLSLNTLDQLKESADGRKQIDGLWMQLLSERDQGRETRKKLYASEKREEKLVSENRRLKMKLFERDNLVDANKPDINSPGTDECRGNSNMPKIPLQEIKLEQGTKVEPIKRTSSKLAKTEVARKKHDIVVTKLEMNEQCKQQ